MSDTGPPLSRTAMAARERASRSRLAQIVSGRPFVRGTLLWRERVCGNAGCKCARGHKHRSLYLVLSEGKGKGQRQLYVPKDWEERVVQWVENHRALKESINDVSQLYWEKVRKRQG